MEKVINSYECLFIVDVANGEEATAAKVNKFTALISNNAEVVEVNEWGKRRLAYLINDEAEGYYVLFNYQATPEFPAELDRVVKITDGVLRSLIVKKN